MNHLTMSKHGRQTLKEHEAVINGLYDDVSGYATYGVGHLVQKVKSVLLDTATAEKLCVSRVRTKWPGTKQATRYLEREAVGCTDFETLKARAAERAPDMIARAQYGKPLSELPDKHKATVRALAAGKVDEEARLLNVSVDSVLIEDLKRFEKAANESVTHDLDQGEFDALVSMTFNIGVANFRGSTLLRKINENKYRTGSIAQRKQAIADIEAEFLKWDKSGGKHLAGLAKRRKAEAAAFLKTAREELHALEHPKHPGRPAPPGPTVVRTPWL